MHQSRKCKQYYFGMKAHIGADADSGLVHTVRGTAGNVSDIVEGDSLLHGQERVVFGDAGYQGVAKRPDASVQVSWHVAMGPGQRRALDRSQPIDALMDRIEKLKVSVRAKVERPFRAIKRVSHRRARAVQTAYKHLHGPHRRTNNEIVVASAHQHTRM